MKATIAQAPGACCQWLAVAGAAVVLVAGMAVLAGTGTAAAAPPVMVNCSTASLQTAITNAAPGATLIVTGTCDDNFSIDKNLTVRRGEVRTGSAVGLGVA